MTTIIPFHFRLLIALFALAGGAAAATIPFASGDSIGEGNSRTNQNVLITPHSLWEQNHADGGKWISYAATGVGGAVVPPDVASVLDAPTASFFEYLSIEDDVILDADLHVWADDTAAVFVNNVLVQAPTPLQDGACAKGVISCEPGEGLHVDIARFLLPGQNVLQFDVYQRAGGPFGLLYDGQVTAASSADPVPEPTTLGLCGISLISLGIVARRRRGTGKPVLTATKHR